MAGSPFLGASVYEASPTLILYNNPPAASILGSTFGAADGFTTENQPINRAIYFTANNINNPGGSAGAIYTSAGTGIYRSLDGGNSWTLALAPVNMGAGGMSTANKSGLNIVTGTDGLQYLCFIYSAYDGTEFHSGYRTTDGYTWTRDYSNSVRSIEQAGYRQDTVSGGVLYCLQGSNVTFYNVATGELGWVIAGTAGSDIVRRATMCVWDNVIYVANYLTNGTRPLYRLDSGLINPVVNLDTSGTTATTTHKMAMFVDSSNLYVFALRVASSTGWACYQVDQSGGPGSYTVTDITSTVISGNMAGAGPGTSSRALAFVDGNAAPGSNPTKYLLYAANGNGGTAVELFQWNGPNAAMSSLGSGGVVTDAFTVSKESTSNGIYIPFGIYPYIISSGPTTAGTTPVGWRINFTLWGPAGTTTSIRLWYGESGDEYLMSVGTLASPTSGSLGVNSTSVTGLAVDSGVTLYSLTWVPPSSITDANGRFRFTLEPF